MGRDVEITLDEIRALATTTLANLRDDVASSRGQFLGAAVGESLFGGTPAGLGLAGTNKAAHDVFAATVDAVLADLEGFRTRLIDTLHRYSDADSDAEAAMLSLSASESGEHYRMGDVQQQAVGAHQDAFTSHASPSEPTAPAATEPATGPAPANARQQGF
jgi:hypothetical protein